VTTNLHSLSYLAKFLLKREMFQTKVVERIITHNLSQINLFNLKSCSLRENVEKNGTARVLTDDNTAQTQLMLNT